MTIKLLGNGNGIITTRTPEIIGDVLELVFDGAASDQIAVISSSGEVFYRALDDGKCIVKSEHLSDEVHFSVMSKDKRLLYK